MSEASKTPPTTAEQCEINCQQVMFILRNKTRDDREEVAVQQLQEAAAVIRDLRLTLLSMFGVRK